MVDGSHRVAFEMSGDRQRTSEAVWVRARTILLPGLFHYQLGIETPFCESSRRHNGDRAQKLWREATKLVQKLHLHAVCPALYTNNQMRANRLISNRGLGELSHGNLGLAVSPFKAPCRFSVLFHHPVKLGVE